MNESRKGVPSSVLVCTQTSPAASRAADGCTMIPYRPGIRLRTTACPTSGEGVTPSDSYCGHTMIMPAATPPVLASGQASFPVIGAIVPLSELSSGMLNMSYVICPVWSPVEPKSSHISTWKPPSPGSIWPLPSCSPFRGQSSSNTNTVTVAVFIGSSGGLTTTGAAVPPVTGPPATPAGNVQVVVVPAVVQVGGGIGAPLIVWPQVGTLCPVGVVPLDVKQLGEGADPLPVLNELA